MGTIFISYRREDSASEAGRLGDWLRAAFGPEQVFMDIDTLTPGDDFVKTIQTAIESCDVLIAMVGEKWLRVADNSGRRRLEDPNDFVALEIATALERGKLVIPVLVQGTSMPRPDDLPPSLETLASRNASEVSLTHWKRDVEVVIEKIRKVVVPAAGSGLKNFATQIETGAYWDDLVVPGSVHEQLREIVDEIVNASPLASQWNVTRPEVSSGTQVLFHGASGTGKVLAARVLAKYLNFDLYQVDYGAVIGRQLVDTANNLEHLLEAAAKRSAIKTVEERHAIEVAEHAGVTAAEDDRGVMILFEDSETLFGMQSNDPKSGNLLGLVRLRGNLIFTTTRKSDLDKKLLGRFSNVVEFPFPDKELRATIWRHAIPPDMPRESDIDYQLLGARFRLSGEDIRKAIYAAATVAKRDGTPVAMRHLEFGAARYNKPDD